MNANDQLPPSLAHNRTRRSRSLPHAFWKSGRLHWLALYPILRLSDLVREGMDHSGSYRFADHIYRGQPSGRLLIGRWLDAFILQQPASRAFRQRCHEATHTITTALDAIPERTVQMLAVPCGLPRDLLAAATARPDDRQRLHYHGLDIDSSLLRQAEALTNDAGVGERTFRHGDALDRQSYPENHFDIAVSTGLGEFLGDDQLARLYANLHRSLAPGGCFFTSATRCEPRSEALLRAFELHTHYRAEPELRRALAPLPWSRLEFSTDPTGLQTFVRAYK